MDCASPSEWFRMITAHQVACLTCPNSEQLAIVAKQEDDLVPETGSHAGRPFCEQRALKLFQ